MMVMKLMMMQDYRNNIGNKNEFGDCGNKDDNNTQDKGKNKGKTIMMAMTLMMMQEYRNNIYLVTKFIMVISKMT